MVFVLPIIRTNRWVNHLYMIIIIPLYNYNDASYPRGYPIGKLQQHHSSQTTSLLYHCLYYWNLTCYKKGSDLCKAMIKLKQFNSSTAAKDVYSREMRVYPLPVQMYQLPWERWPTLQALVRECQGKKSTVTVSRLQANERRSAEGWRGGELYLLLHLLLLSQFHRMVPHDGHL